MLKDPDAQKITGEALQSALLDLIDLSLLGKQFHWTVNGPNFRSLHLQLDEIVTSARSFSDLVAERAAALGIAPDGRARTVAEGSGLPQPSAAWQQDHKVVDALVALHDQVIERMRERIAATAEPDPVSQDIFIQITAELEKQRWMFQAEK